jgi:hypothetical protein
MSIPLVSLDLLFRLPILVGDAHRSRGNAQKSRNEKPCGEGAVFSRGTTENFKSALTGGVSTRNEAATREAAYGLDVVCSEWPQAVQK